MDSETLRVGAFEAKTKFSELLERVRRGATITITRHDEPVARLVGYESLLAKRRVEATASLRHLRARYRLGRLNGRSLREEGRA
jgi:prevent-host-death family protein